MVKFSIDIVCVQSSDCSVQKIKIDVVMELIMTWDTGNSVVLTENLDELIDLFMILLIQQGEHHDGDQSEVCVHDL
ncbi:hypothetical protein WICPIJ_005635 [Wickerhamomyces pijperi]|uniref:Uncharacterized protein n=1 Tax=Wickerhamomyces pijperi TaxID=599730 RepID=A0A9P8TLN4_WICPI|nr:hypothetical protein WICPIJ_005635 [Wickerhamomyces pijperi]